MIFIIFKIYKFYLVSKVIYDILYIKNKLLNAH